MPKDPTKVKKLAEKVVENNGSSTLAILQDTTEIVDSTNSLIDMVKMLQDTVSALKGAFPEYDDSQIRAELANLNEELKKKEFFSQDTFNEVVKEVLGRIPTPTNGKDGNKGKAGKDGIDGETPTDERIISLLEPLIPDIIIPDTVEEIRDKLEALEGDERLDKKSIKGLEETETSILERATSILDSRTSFLINKINNLPSSSGGISSLNGLTDATQTFATGTSGTDFNISSSGTAHTFNIPDASTSARGVVTTGSQTFYGQKQFQYNGGGTDTAVSVLLRQGSSSNGSTTRQDSPRLGWLGRAWTGSANYNFQSEMYLRGVAGSNPMQWALAYSPDSVSPAEKWTLLYGGTSDTNVRMGLNGVTAPTAWLHAPAGTTGAGTAPVKLNVGTLMTTPEDGALEYASSHLYFTMGSTRYQLDNAISGAGTGNWLTYWVTPSILGALSTGTYPNLTELSYLKGVSSSVQTQLNTKLSSAVTSLTSANTEYLSLNASTGALTITPVNLVKTLFNALESIDVADTDTETSVVATGSYIGTQVITHNTSHNGSSFFITASGVLQGSSDNLEIFLYFNSTVICGTLQNFPFTGDTEKRPWSLNIEVTRRSATTVIARGMFHWDNKEHSAYPIGLSMSDVDPINIDDMDGNDITVDLTMKWAGTSSQIRTDIFSIRRSDPNS